MIKTSILSNSNGWCSDFNRGFNFIPESITSKNGWSLTRTICIWNVNHKADFTQSLPCNVDCWRCFFRIQWIGNVPVWSISATTSLHDHVSKTNIMQIPVFMVNCKRARYYFVQLRLVFLCLTFILIKDKDKYFKTRI